MKKTSQALAWPTDVFRSLLREYFDGAAEIVQTSNFNEKFIHLRKYLLAERFLSLVFELSIFAATSVYFYKISQTEKFFYRIWIIVVHTDRSRNFDKKLTSSKIIEIPQFFKIFNIFPEFSFSY